MSTLFIESKILIIYNEDDSFNHEAQERPTFPQMQTLAFGDGFVPLTSNFDTPRTRACKLPSVQGQPNKKFEFLFFLNGCKI